VISGPTILRRGWLVLWKGSDNIAVAGGGTMKFKPLTPEQVTRGICMRRYAWGKRVRQIADESGVPARVLRDVMVGKPFSEAVRCRLEGYLRTPAGPEALRQDNDRSGDPDAQRFRLLRRIMRTRSLAKQFDLPLCDRDRLKSFTDGQLRAYFYNLDDRIKRHVTDQDPTIAQRWKLADDMPAWEFIERLDQLRAHRQERNSRLRP
jgi:hypothetical protein